MSDVPHDPHDDPDHLPDATDEANDLVDDGDATRDESFEMDGFDADGADLDDLVDLDDVAELEDLVDVDEMVDADEPDRPLTADIDLTDGSDGSDAVAADDATESGAPDLESAIQLDVEPAEASGFDQLGGLLSDVELDAHEFERTMDALGLSAEPDGRSIVATFEQLDIPARIEHQTVDRLADLLSEGAEVRLASGHVVLELDDRTDEAVVEIGGERSRLPLGELEDRWSHHSFEAIVAETGRGRVVLLPASGAPPGDEAGDTRDGGLSG
jgi:hypothetical protein